MLHIPGLSHRQHRKDTRDGRQASASAPTASAAGLANTSTLQRSPTGGSHLPGHSHALHAARDPYAGQHVVAETHHLRYLPIKHRHGLFRKPTHHMYEFDTHFHGLHSAMAPYSTSTTTVSHALTPTTTTTTPVTTTSTTSATTINDERVPTTISTTPPAPRRYGTDISTSRMRSMPQSATTPAPTGPCSPLATSTPTPTSGPTALGFDRTHVTTIPTPGTECHQDREVLIKTTTRGTPAIVDPVTVPVSERAENVTAVIVEGQENERQEVTRDATFNRSRDEYRDRFEARPAEVEDGETASISTNDMYARAFDEQGVGATGTHPQVMPAVEWVETHYRTECGRFEEVVRRE